AGLEVVPRRRSEHRGVTLWELDLPAILARAPELCLIDELAHTNVPGVEHRKRYEDIADVLQAGIDVFSTVNVQHLESLNDQVADLTGVRVRETVPDDLVARADEIVLVDLTPEDLVERLRAGKVYPAARIATALNGFFRVENLQALREVALRQVAEDVGAKRLEREPLAVREDRLFGSPPSEPLPLSERLLAIVGLDERDERVIRRAWRSAQRLSGELDILVVRAPESRPGARERERLEALRRLASALGAHLLVEEGSDPAQVAARVARERGTTYVLLGAPAARRSVGLLRTPLPLRLVQELPGVDVRIVADRPRPSS
ncbi:MAG TPA: histidine kinase, partial [Solirubrobacteraceae bacterium]|nr:histidine kinase [Solirubrobacteraceae bacterium]